MKYIKKVKYNSPVVLTFAIISLCVLILNIATHGYSNHYLFSVYRSSPFNLFFWVRLFGHVLGHAGLEHYSGNMLLILLLGPMLEEKYGSGKLAAMMGAVAVITGVFNIIVFPNSALLGASGIVFMMMILSSAAGMKKGEIPLTLVVVTVIYIGQEVLTGITTRDNISQLTHIIGGLCGGAFGLILGGSSEKHNINTF